MTVLEQKGWSNPTDIHEALSATDLGGAALHAYFQREPGLFEAFRQARTDVREAREAWHASQDPDDAARMQAALKREATARAALYTHAFEFKGARPVPNTRG